MEKADIHSHIISGIDDGARNQEDSIRMLERAAHQGFRIFIATPHYSPRFRNICPELIRENCARLEEEARKSVHSGLRIYPGQEIFYEEGVEERLDRGELLTLADSSYVLVEFAPRTGHAQMYRALQGLRLAGYTPVLAHAERYTVLIEEEDLLDEFIEAGVRVQLNYGSIGGGLLDGRARWCRRQLRSGRVHFLGTDMHDTAKRAPDTERAAAWMEKQLSGVQREALFHGNAERLLANEYIAPAM